MLIFPQHQIVVRIDKNQPNDARDADRDRQNSESVTERSRERNTETKHCEIPTKKKTGLKSKLWRWKREKRYEKHRETREKLAY